MGSIGRPVRLKILVFFLIAVLWGAGFLYLRREARILDEELRILEDEVRVRTVRRFSFEDPDEFAEWEEKKFARNATEYGVTDHDGRTCVRAYSDSAASAMYLRETLSYRGRPHVSWDWKVAKFPDKSKEETLGSKEEFDFAMQFYVVFYARSLLNARAIQYVWTRDLPEGKTADSPYTRNIKMLVIRSGNEGEWKSEERDIAEDHLRLFGEELETDVMAVAFMTDSDNTTSEAEAFIANIELGYRPVSTPGEDGESGKDEAPDASVLTDQSH